MRAQRIGPLPMVGAFGVTVSRSPLGNGGRSGKASRDNHCQRGRLIDFSRLIDTHIHKGEGRPLQVFEASSAPNRAPAVDLTLMRAKSK